MYAIQKIRKFWTLALLSLFAVSLAACELLDDVLEGSNLSESEIIEGLKTALNVGTDASVAQLSQVNGYFNDAVVKILLPAEAQDVVRRLNSTAIGRGIYQNALQPIAEDLILSINRAAEDAASEAAPVFKSAITGMTIQDGRDILFGVDTAATAYLRRTTYQGLFNGFQPRIDTSLQKPLVGNESANRIWQRFINTYNDIARSPANIALNLDPIRNENLSVHATTRGLEGLFYKIALEEKEIRTNPRARINDILRKVFGELD
ncbi:MAG: DUF4197 domain-containing protein [Bernardetiaceae bacterium]|nr:DUF4197 domain-containing protein [Bernardetiaceae bacterium]